MKPPECPDCGAFLQEAVTGLMPVLRCPWTTSWRWRMNGHVIPPQMYCDRPMGVKRVVGGIRVESVR